MDLWRCLLSSGPAPFVNINYYCSFFFYLSILLKTRDSDFDFILTDDFKFHTLGLQLVGSGLFIIFCLALTMSFLLL